MRIVYVALACLVMSLPVRAWNGTGHQVVCQIAWRDLRPEVRAKITALIQKHPYFKRHLEPADAGSDTPEYAMRSFMLAATWPDLLRGARDPKERQHHRAEWHYVNLPIIPEGTDRSAIQVGPTELKLDPARAPQNITQALEWCIRRVKDPAASLEEQAVVLAWILHLVGDLHQPLHASGVYSADYPAGDRGGNLFMVKYHGNVTDLHTFWDNILGRYEAPRLITAVTEKVLAEHPRQKLAERLKLESLAGWTNESFALSRDIVYVRGKLKGITRAASIEDKTGTSVPELPEGYDVTTRETARVQLAVAGYRLADLLNRVFE